MNQIIFKGSLLFVAILFLAFNLSKASAFSGIPFHLKDTEPTLMNVPHQIVTRKLDKEAEILAEYLTKHNSPLQYHAQDFIDAARVYNLDWRLVPAIAGVESTFGKFIPGGYNGWGWGVYGNQAVYFKSWKEGIFTVSRGLRENYINSGLTDPYSMNRVYAASPHWGWKVTYFMNDIDRFAKEYDKVRIVADTYPLMRIAVISGQLTYSN